MAEYAWRREPLGDEVERFEGSTGTGEGCRRALANWSRLRHLLEHNSGSNNLQIKLSASQFSSFRLLVEWWNGESQPELLSEAARNSITKAADVSESASQYLDVDREAALLNQSTYHTHMFLLFQLEFVHEARIPQFNDFHTFLGLLQAQRERCAQFAALQRVAHACHIQATCKNSGPPDIRQPRSSESLSHSLGKVIPACIEACPWLKIREVETARPYFLWDVRNMRTVIVEELVEAPDYLCVSHTWGRWPKKSNDGTLEPPIKVLGVPWLVPQNEKFAVEELPSMLKMAFCTSSAYIWFDLLCIPQDYSERAFREISRQALIFGNAKWVIAWLNDVHSWNGLSSVVDWLSLFYLNTAVNLKTGDYQFPLLPDPFEDVPPSPMELCLWRQVENDNGQSNEDSDDSEDMDIAPPVPWFTSLWTLQEACLRPDMILFNKHWQPLTAGDQTLVPLDHLVSLDNYISRGNYRSSVIKTTETFKAMNLGDPVDIEKTPGAYDLSSMFTDTCMSEVLWASPSAIFTFGQLRRCTKSRAEAIMSVVGATEWYKDFVSKYKVPPPETDLILGLYPLSFLAEAITKLGPTFYTAIPVNLHYLSGAVDLSEGSWNAQADAKAVGSVLPFTSSSTFLVPPQQFAFASDHHPAVQTWALNRDGSLTVKQAGILSFGPEENVEKDYDDTIHTIDHTATEEAISYDTELDTLECKDVQEWLSSFADPGAAPNYAVCLYQQIYLNRDIPGPQVGLLLKQVDLRGSQTRLVKVGIYFTRASRAWDVTTKSVDWIVL